MQQEVKNQNNKAMYCNILESLSPEACAEKHARFQGPLY